MLGVTGAAPRGKTELRARWRASVGDYAVDASLSHDGALTAIGTGAGEVVVFDVETGAERWRRALHAGGVSAVAFSPRGALLATAGQDGRACLLDADGSTLAELPGRGGWVEHLAWSPDGRLLATTSGRVLRVWSSAGEPVVETEPHPSTIAGLAWRQGGRQIATCCYGGVHVWAVAAGKRDRHLAWKGSLVSLAWSPDGKVIACGSQDASVHFWRLSSRQDSEMRGYPFKPKAIAWDAGSTLLATAGDKTVTVWNFSGKGPEGKPPLELEGHEALCTALAFAPKGPFLASGSEDTGVILWEPNRGPKPVRFAFLEDEVTKLAWHPGGRRLLAADASGHVALFEVE